MSPCTNVDARGEVENLKDTMSAEFENLAKDITREMAMEFDTCLQFRMTGQPHQVANTTELWAV